MQNTKYTKQTAPFFSVEDMNMTAMSKRLTLARFCRTCSVKARDSFLRKADVHLLLAEVTCETDFNPLTTPSASSKTYFMKKLRTVLKIWFRRSGSSVFWKMLAYASGWICCTAERETCYKRGDMIGALQSH